MKKLLLSAGGVSTRISRIPFTRLGKKYLIGVSVVTESMILGGIASLSDIRRETAWWELAFLFNEIRSAIPVIEIERSLTMPELLELVKPLLKDSIRDYIAEERREILDKIRHAKAFDDVYNAL